MTLALMLSAGTTDIVAIEDYVQSLDVAARRREVLSLDRSQQAWLFEVARAHRGLSRESLVPPEVPALTGVPHQGRNSLRAFTRFAKVMCRPSPGLDKGDNLWGFNRNAPLVHHSVGPGFYVAYARDGEFVVDYTQLPSERAPGWPEIVPNSYRLSRFVFQGMQVVLRGVSEHVTIGRAMRDGLWLQHWFVLVREEQHPSNDTVSGGADGRVLAPGRSGSPEPSG